MMKTIKKMTLVVLMFVSILSYAEKRKTANFSKVTVVEFLDAKKGQQLLVKDEYGIILYSETIKNSGDLTKAFDLNQLKDGNYFVELNKDFEVLIKPFQIKNNTVTFNAKQETKVFKPRIRVLNKKLLLSQMSLESKPVELEIYFEGDLIYSESIKGEKIVNRIYKFQEIKFGNYSITVRVNNRTYIESFNL